MAQPTQEPAQKDLLALLEDLSTMATGNRTLELLEEIEQNRDDPNYKPPTFGELFGTEDGLNVFGEILPDDIEGLASEPVTSDWLRGPLRSIAVNKRRLTKGAEQLQKAQEDFKKRAQRRARAHVRKTPGGTKRVRQFLQSMGVRDLNLFSAGVAKNRLVFGSRTRMHVGVVAPVQLLDLGKEIDAAAFAPDNQEDREAFELMQLQHFEGLLLDHSSAIGMAIGSAVGHDRVDRKITMQLSYLDKNAELRKVRRISENGKETQLLRNNDRDLESSDQANDKLAASRLENPATLEVTLDYSFQLAKSRVNDTVEMLQLVSGQPIFRGLSLSADEDDDQLVGLAAGATSLDSMLDDDDAVDAPVEEEELVEEEPEGPTDEELEAAELDESDDEIDEDVGVEAETVEETAEDPVEEEAEEEEPEPAPAQEADTTDEEDLDIDLSSDDLDDEEEDEFADLFADVGL